MTPARLSAALPPLARQALALARLCDNSCDAASAWLAAHDHPHATPDALARSIRAATRRARRAGGSHGPARFYGQPDTLPDQPEGGDPCALLEAMQALAARPGIDAVLDEREGVSNTREMAERDRCTRRRVQQALAERRAVEMAGQETLL